MGHIESSPKNIIHSITGLSQERRKISNKQSKFTLKWTGEKTRTNTTQSEEKEEKNEDKGTNKYIESKKLIEKNNDIPRAGSLKR